MTANEKLATPPKEVFVAYQIILASVVLVIRFESSIICMDTVANAKQKTSLTTCSEVIIPHRYCMPVNLWCLHPFTEQADCIHESLKRCTAIRYWQCTH